MQKYMFYIPNVIFYLQIFLFHWPTKQEDMRKRICNKYTSVAAILRRLRPNRGYSSTGYNFREWFNKRYSAYLTAIEIYPTQIFVQKKKNWYDRKRVSMNTSSHSALSKSHKSHRQVLKRNNLYFLSLSSNEIMIYFSPLWHINLKMQANLIADVRINFPPWRQILSIRLNRKHSRDNPAALTATHAEKDGMQQVLVNGLFRTFLLFRRRLRQRWRMTSATSHRRATQWRNSPRAFRNPPLSQNTSTHAIYCK